MKAHQQSLGLLRFLNILIGYTGAILSQLLIYPSFGIAIFCHLNFLYVAWLALISLWALTQLSIVPRFWWRLRKVERLIDADQKK